MPTADSVHERSLALAQADLETEEAVRALLEFCDEHRVPVVLAHQRLLQDMEEHPSDLVQRAVELIERALDRLPE